MFQIRQSIFKAAAVLAITAAIQSCSKNDKPTPPQDSSQYFTVVSQSNGSEYLASTPSLTTGKLSFIGNGLETSAARYLYHHEYVYLMNTATKKFIQYKMTADGKITENATILTAGVTPNYFTSINLVDDNTLLVLGAENNHLGNAGWARIKLPEFTVIDKGTFKLPYDVNLNVASDIGKGYVDNGKFIAGSNRYVLDGTKPAGESIEGAYALVYDYPSFANMKLIKNPVTTGNVGHTYLSSLATDEAGDHYFVVSAGKYWGGNGGKSGVLRIKKGASEFDNSYFFDVTTPAGKSACLTTMSYVSNGLAFGAVQYEDLMTQLSDRYKPIAQIVKLDLAKKTVTTMNTPLSPVGQFRSPLVFNGKYYTAVVTANGTNVYEFDPSGDGNAFKKGLQLDGNDIFPNLIAPHPAK